MLGRDLSRLGSGDLVEVRRDLGFIFQMHNLFEALSAYENVKMAAQLGDGSTTELRRRGTGILQRLGLGHRIGYKPRFLSGGERQRVAIGRALVNRPQLILADEPTAALDRDATMNVIRLLKQTTVEDGAAVLMVTHDHRVINSADRLVHMVDGRIMSDVVLHDALRICEFLRPIELFKTLTPRQLTDVAEKMSKRHYAAGETIIRKGDPGEEFFLVSDGEVEISRADREVATLGPGNFFGEVALISGEPRNATVVAQRRSTFMCSARLISRPRSPPARASATSSTAPISSPLSSTPRFWPLKRRKAHLKRRQIRLLRRADGRGGERWRLEGSPYRPLRMIG